MFFCETCRAERDWPESMSRSTGRCEMCGNRRLCYDVPTALPSRPTLTKTGNPMSEETGHYTITVSIKHVTPATTPLHGGSRERTIADLLTTTVQAATLPEAIRRAKAVIDVAAPPSAE